MALYKITVKNSATTNGIRIEKGMSVQVISKLSNPLSSSKGRDEVSEAFSRIYGIDMRKIGKVTPSYLEVEKIN